MPDGPALTPTDPGIVATSSLINLGKEARRVFSNEVRLSRRALI
jgi:hypothetical protein